MRTRLSVGSIAILVLAFALAMRVGRAAPSGEWRAYASDKGGSRYSPLDQINRTTVKNLKIAWRQSILPPEMREAGTNPTIPNVSQNTALMVGGRLFVSTVGGVIAALDPGSGRVLWYDRPPARPSGTGILAPRPLRGLAYWTDGR